jgi:hypothetical protein
MCNHVTFRGNAPGLPNTYLFERGQNGGFANMDVKTKLGIAWVAIGMMQIIVAHFFIARKQDPFADPNFWIAKKWIKSMKNVQKIANYAMDSNFIERQFLVNMIVSIMTKLGICMIFLGSIHFLSFWTTTGAIVFSSIGFAIILVYGIFSFTFKCISYSKDKAVKKGVKSML